MALDSNALKNKASGALTGFSTGQRAVVMVAALTLVIGGVFFAQWAAKPTMSPLFSNVSSEDASSITAALQKSGTQYELSDGGTTILVPKNEVYQARIDMAGQGLPSGGSQGYKLLEKQGITTSEFRERVDYQRAIEGELANTIGSINGVQGATVHVVIPQNDVFSDDSVKPTASVLIKTAPGKSLSNGSVQAVANLVASSIEGLTADNVTVADANGRLLSGQGQSAGDTESQRATTASQESELSAKIQSLLTPVVGQGKAVVQAKMQLNWDKSQTTAEQFNPNNKPATVQSQRSTTETYGGGSGTGTTTGCIGVGTPDTAACQAAQSAASGSTGYTKTDGATQNVVDRSVTSTEKAPGSIDRLSLSVVLDSNVANIDTTQIENIVKDAAGFSAARGDTITVSRLPFDQTFANSAADELKAAEKAKKSEDMMSLIKTVATVVIILIVLAVLFFTTKKKAKLYSATPISLAELEAASRPALPAAEEMLSSIEAAPALDANSPEALERVKVDKEITDLIERQPDEVASLLRSWLADRRT